MFRYLVSLMLMLSALLFSLTALAQEVPVPDMDITILLAAISAHAWPVAVGSVLVLLVYLARLPVVATQWQRLPAWSRPLLPVLLGLLSGVGEALSTQQPWLPALVGGLVAALPALLAALPSPTAHLDQIILPNSPVVKITTQPLDRDTEPTGR